MARILYISHTGLAKIPHMDGSVRYRCIYPAEAARNLGHQAVFVPFDYFKPEMADSFDAVVFHRPPLDDKVEQLLEKLEQSGKPYCADYDDLVVNVAHARAFPQLRHNAAWNMDKALSTFSMRTHALRLFPKVTVSTAPLADEVLAVHPGSEVAVVHNAFPKRLRAVLRDMRKLNMGVSRPFIGYFSGSITHNFDFESVSKDLAEIIRKYSLRLMVVGPVKLPDALSKLDLTLIRPERVEQKWTLARDFYSMFSYIYRCHTVIAPLENTPFTNCKSGIKFLESGSCMTRVVATAIPDMERFAGQGVNLVAHGGSWFEVLDRIFSDPASSDELYRISEYLLTTQQAETTVKKQLSLLGVA